MTKKENERILDSESETEVTELRGAVFEGAKMVTLTSEYSATATSATPNELIFIGWPNDETMVVGSTLNVYPFDDTTDQSVQVQWEYENDMVSLQMEEIFSQCYRARIVALKAGTTTISARYGSKTHSRTLTIKPQMQIYLSPAPHEKKYTKLDGSQYPRDEWNEKKVMEHIADVLDQYLSDFCVRVLISKVYTGDDYVYSERAKDANKWIDDNTNAFYLALHSNACAREDAGKGTGGTGFHNNVRESGEVALNLVEAIDALSPTESNRSSKTPVEVEKDEMAFTEYFGIPAIIFEIAFHDNPCEAEFLIENQELIAEEIGKTLVSYYNLVRK